MLQYPKFFYSGEANASKTLSWKERNLDTGVVVTGDTIQFPDIIDLRKAVRRLVESEGYTIDVRRRICLGCCEYLEWFSKISLPTYHAPVAICTVAVLTADEVAPSNHMLARDIERSIVNALTDGEEHFNNRCLKVLESSIKLREDCEEVRFFRHAPTSNDLRATETIWERK